MTYREVVSRLSQRRFLKDFGSTFTARADGTSWARRDETWKAATAYFHGLLGHGKSKTMEGIACRMSLNPNKVQQFVTDSPWDPGKATEGLMDRMAPDFSSPEGVLVVDDTGIPKQGTHSVGTARQYSGTLGRVANCQVAVDVVYVLPGRRRNADAVIWPLGLELYLPREWTDDMDRRAEAFVPKDVRFQTKPDIALGMIDMAVARGLRFRCIVTDAAYGESGEFREALRRRGIAYAAGVNPTNIRVVDAKIPVIPPGRGEDGRPRKYLTYPKGVDAFSPADLASRLRNDEWTTIEWSRGTKGPLRGLFFRTKVRVVHPGQKRRATDEVAWLLLEKRPNELKAYLCHGLDGCGLKELVRIVHQRWAVELFHKEVKQTLGLDIFEGRTWPGWRHHAAMVCLAYAFLAALRARAGNRGRLPSFESIHWLVVEKFVEGVVMKAVKTNRNRAKLAALEIVTEVIGLRQPTE